MDSLKFTLVLWYQDHRSVAIGGGGAPMFRVSTKQAPSRGPLAASLYFVSPHTTNATVLRNPSSRRRPSLTRSPTHEVKARIKGMLWWVCMLSVINPRQEKRCAVVRDLFYLLHHRDVESRGGSGRECKCGREVV